MVVWIDPVHDGYDLWVFVSSCLRLDRQRHFRTSFLVSLHGGQRRCGALSTKTRGTCPRASDVCRIFHLSLSTEGTITCHVVFPPFTGSWVHSFPLLITVWS